MLELTVHLHHCQFVSHCLITAILEMLNTMEDEDRMLKGETRAKISGFYKQATQLRTCFGVVCSEALFRPSKAVCRAKPPLLVQPQSVSKSFSNSCRH